MILANARLDCLEIFFLLLSTFFLSKRTSDYKFFVDLANNLTDYLKLQELADILYERETYKYSWFIDIRPRLKLILRIIMKNPNYEKM